MVNTARGKPSQLKLSKITESHTASFPCTEGRGRTKANDQGIFDVFNMI